MRQRMTWKDGAARRRASQHPATPDEGPASPAHKADPGPDDYKSGDTSSWAEDVHAGPYEDSAHPATPDEGPASPAHKAAAMERKAAKCIRLATAMLGGDASVAMIEDQALSLMDLSERAIKSSLSRLADDDDDDDDGDDEESSKKAGLDDRLARLENALIRLADDDDDEKKDDGESKGDESKTDLDYEGDKKATSHDDDEEAADDDDDEASKKASLEARLGRLEDAILRLGASEDPKGDSDDAVGDDSEQDADADKDDAAGAEESSKKAKHLNTALDEMVLEEMMQEEGMTPLESDDALSPEEAMLAEMMAEEGMDQNEPEAYYEGGKDPVPNEDPAVLAEQAGDEGMGMVGEPELAEPVVDVEMELDPMGLMDDPGMDESEMMILANLFGREAAESEEKKEEDEKGAEAEAAKTIQEDKEHKAEGEASKKAAQRPQPKKASTGATRLGGVSKEAQSEVNDLSKLWESAPDVSRFF